MKKILLMAALLWPVSAAAEEALSDRATHALQQVELLATTLDLAFDYLTTYIGYSGASDQLVHAEMAAITARVPAIRSILVIEEGGTLTHDAYTFPAPGINLSNRTYVREARHRIGLALSEPVVGRTSGAPFVPAAEWRGAIKSTLVAILDMRELRKPFDWCGPGCGGGIVTMDGNVIVHSPAEARVPRSLIVRITDVEDREGTFLFERENFRAEIAFRKSDDLPIAVYVVKALTPPTLSAVE